MLGLVQLWPQGNRSLGGSSSFNVGRRAPPVVLSKSSMTRAFIRLQISAIMAVLSVSLFLLAFYSCYYPQLQNSIGMVDHRSFVSQEFRFPSFSGRKLLERGTLPSSSSSLRSECTKEDIVVHQGATGPLPNGIPTYTVEVLNLCEKGCAMAGIHLSCGPFSSATLVNPRLFRRLGINDCLLNDGRPFPPGASISFKYANSFSYPMRVASAQCVRNS